MELLKCNTAFLPDPRSSGQGAGKQDQAAAIANVQKRKQEALEKQLDAGDDSGKTREHLEPKKRVGDGGSGGGRYKLSEALVSMVQNQNDMAQVNARRLAMEEKNQMAERLDKYMQYVMNPNTPETYKASYHVMIAGLQRQLHAADMATSFLAPAAVTPAAVTPAATTPASTPTRSRDMSARSDDSGILGP